MKILYVSSEASPFVKTGGLGDVAGSLPSALINEGAEIRVFLPMYTSIKEDLLKDAELVSEFSVKVSWRTQYCGLYYLFYEGVAYYFTDNKYYFSRNSVYGEFDDAERYAYFSKAVLEAISHIDFIPDIIHCNDWQTALIPIYLKAFYNDLLPHTKTVFTIHSMGYQGIFSPDIITDVLGLHGGYYNPGCFMHFGACNLMKGAIYLSDAVTTVSETYKEEIKTPLYGCTLDGDLNTNSYKLYGILNGIDIKEYNPWTDKLIYKRYSKNNPANKAVNKLCLQRDCGFPEDESIPVISLITRLVNPKGIDLLLEILDEILQKEIQIILLGTGDTIYESIFLQKAKEYPSKLFVKIAFDNAFAHKIYAGSDIFLMPSRFEPCGLAQMIAMRYGTLPLVRETGGLKDTVIPFNQFSNEGTGFTFTNVNSGDLKNVLSFAIDTYHENKPAWQKLVNRAMNSDFSWKTSAKKYLEIYEKDLL